MRIITSGEREKTSHGSGTVVHAAAVPPGGDFNLDEDEDEEASRSFMLYH